MEEQAAQALLEDLDPEQRQVAEHQSGALCVLAGAGTGKTRAITYRIAYGARSGQLDPSTVMALSFTKRAAGEMRHRLAGLGVPGVATRTFHSAAFMQARHFWPHVVGGGFPELMEQKIPLLSAAATRLNLRLDRAMLRDLAGEIEWAKAMLCGPENYAQQALSSGRDQVGELLPGRVADFYQAYEEVKTQRNALDYEDLLLVTAGMIEEREDVAREVRSRYRSFVVDEYQDVSPLQNYLLLQWLGKRRDLCVVGDVAQTIYSFTGATPRFLTDFPRSYPEAKVVQLVRDYRSTPQVVSLANRILSQAKDQQGRPLAGTVRLIAQQPSGPAVEFFDTPDDQAEAAEVVRRIRKLQEKGIALADMAVLFRRNAQSEAFEHALAAAGLGYQVKNGERYFERKEIRRALVALKHRAQTTPSAPVVETLEEVLLSLGWTESAPESQGAVREIWEALDALRELGRVEAAGGKDLPALVKELQQRADEQNSPQVEGVNLVSLHSAKGLEWKVVFLTGAYEGSLPIAMARDNAGIEEERRLLYVGVTRAREYLYISMARAKQPEGKAVREVSRFLAQLWPPGGGEVQRRAALKHRAATGRKGREAFEQEASAEELARFEALKEWRLQVAKELEKPAYTVFADATLYSIARAKPNSLVALRNIHGVGDTKLERWGTQVLQVLKTVP